MFKPSSYWGLRLLWELSLRKCCSGGVTHDSMSSVIRRLFDIVCARLRSSLESLKELVLHTWFLSKDDLIQQSFSAFLCVYSFVEVDPRHDEILRKKEEHDREKPQRHLFRFPRMGMWTKLRPGVWNFMEKSQCGLFL
ncbi:uncharacterized protein LOC141611837 [Silene latifolia]|uniref:uncharacterized protein LOC141611837 n=1 Tax=Silene latifolia TaxID=37657 RepID=UPI003D780C68